MKIFKKLVLVFITCFMIACDKDDSALVVDEQSLNVEDIFNAKLIDNSSGVSVEVTTKFLKNKWEKELKEEGSKVILEKFVILKSQNENGELFYFLKAISKDGTLETGAFISLQESSGTSEETFILGKKTCSCTGCANGCALFTAGDTCRCTGCPAGGPQGCIKKEEAEIGY